MASQSGGMAPAGADCSRALQRRALGGWPSGVLGVTLEVLRMIATGTPTEDAVCTCLSREVDAVVAAYVALNPGTRTAAIVAWPPSLDLAQLMGFLNEQSVGLPRLLDQLVIHRRVLCLPAADDRCKRRNTTDALSRKESLCCSELALVPLDVPGPVRRLVVLGRNRSFCVDTVHLLECLRGPLTDLVCVAGERPLPAADAESEHGLTDREVEVLRLTAQGLLARTIAARLEISPRTVHKHLGSIYRKLDVHDRLVAVSRAEGLGLLASNRPPVATPRPDRPPFVKW